jgi:hypothetical protein
MTLEVIAVVWPDCKVTYVGQQHAFGKSIAAFQEVSLPLAEHATLVEAWQCRERDQCRRRQSRLRGPWGTTRGALMSRPQYLAGRHGRSGDECRRPAWDDRRT